MARVCAAPCQSNFCVLGGVGVATLGEFRKNGRCVCCVRGRRTGSKSEEVRVLLNGREWDGRQLGRTYGAVPLGQVCLPGNAACGMGGATGGRAFGEGKTVLIGAASKLGAAQGCERARGHGKQQVAEKGPLVRRAVFRAQDMRMAEQLRVSRAAARLAVMGFVRVTCSRAGAMGRDWADRAGLQVHVVRVAHGRRRRG